MKYTIRLLLLQSTDMATITRPDVTIVNDNATYHSLDADDQGIFNGLTTDIQRKKFIEMILRLQVTNCSLPNS